ncbi:charged multivesicular body protein 5 [Tripterygium wilfordii]|uniref:Charged multivesicular body protein 5 n=1 Tax=Tripterygium wilfordii TaxID=458696 RepID=A0A7J7C5L5_TRIWF|nr:charged multivesicular body protein 5 [Tripterygium wilfordii]
MKRMFGVKKDKEPPPSINDASDRISKRGETVDEKIKKLDAELSRYKEQIKKTRPGPAQEAVKARAMRVLKQKRMYEGQRDMLYNQTFNLDQVAFAAEGIKDAQQTIKNVGTSTIAKYKAEISPSRTIDEGAREEDSLSYLKLNTVCKELQCPNNGEVPPELYGTLGGS